VINIYVMNIDELMNIDIQLSDAQSQLARRDDKIRELSRLIELARENDTRHSAAAHELMTQINEYQHKLSAANSVGLADVDALHDRIRDLEDRIRSVHSSFVVPRPTQPFNPSGWVNENQFLLG